MPRRRPGRPTPPAASRPCRRREPREAMPAATRCAPTRFPAGRGLAKAGAAPRLSAVRSTAPSATTTSASSWSSVNKADAVAAIQARSSTAPGAAQPARLPWRPRGEQQRRAGEGHGAGEQQLSRREALAPEQQRVDGAGAGRTRQPHRLLVAQPGQVGASARIARREPQGAPIGEHRAPGVLRAKRRVAPVHLQRRGARMHRGKRPQGALGLGEEAHAQQPVGFVQRFAVRRAGAVPGKPACADAGMLATNASTAAASHAAAATAGTLALAARGARCQSCASARNSVDDASIQRLLRGGRIEGGGFKAFQNRRHGGRLDAERTRRPARRDHQHGRGLARRRGAAEGAPQRFQRLPALAASRAPRRTADAVQCAGEEDAGRQIETRRRHAAVAASPRLRERLRRRAQRHVGAEQRGDRRRGLRAAACLRRHHARRGDHFAGADEPASAHGQRDRLTLRAAVLAGLRVEVGECDGRDFRAPRCSSRARWP